MSRAYSEHGNRLYKFVFVPKWHGYQILLHGAKLPVCDELPGGSRIIDAHEDEGGDRWVFDVTHESFEEVEDLVPCVYLSDSKDSEARQVLE